MFNSYVSQISALFSPDVIGNFIYISGIWYISL